DVRLTQTTDFPQEEATRLRLSLARPTSFTLRLRVPGWAVGMTISVNGLPAAIACVPGQWASIAREWHDGDTVEAVVPMALRAIPVDRQHPHRAALVCGPVVLAQDEACCRRPFSIAPDTALESRLIREGRSLRFRITNTVPERHTRYLTPLYEFPENWPYWVYFDLHAAPLY
ncbi:MAG: glycoside hydrolase family 127 protein, partial [Alphaproteobacteria bacterium]|nr:glycoside hydrolase family 127 protein [Alphaproteobacteria bacterium]